MQSCPFIPQMLIGLQIIVHVVIRVPHVDIGVSAFVISP
jgi:hypothetical protein